MPQEWEYRIDEMYLYPDVAGLNALGAEGWELAAVVYDGTTPVRWVYKRAKTALEELKRQYPLYWHCRDCKAIVAAGDMHSDCNALAAKAATGATGVNACTGAQACDCGVEAGERHKVGCSALQPRYARVSR